MTHEEFETHWLPAVRLLARASVHLDDFKIDENYPPRGMCAKLSEEIEQFITIVPGITG